MAYDSFTGLKYRNLKAATSKEIKDELGRRSPKELLELVSRLARFKKENKELLTYLLFEAQDEWAYGQSIRAMMDVRFEEVNRKNYYLIKKGIRKILRDVKKYIRYSNSKETEVELLIYFCQKMVGFSPTVKRSRVLVGLYERQLKLIESRMEKLHEDLQFDYREQVENLKVF